MNGITFDTLTDYNACSNENEWNNGVPRIFNDERWQKCIHKTLLHFKIEKKKEKNTSQQPKNERKVRKGKKESFAQKHEKSMKIAH